MVERNPISSALARTEKDKKKNLKKDKKGKTQKKIEKIKQYLR